MLETDWMRWGRHPNCYVLVDDLATSDHQAELCRMGPDREVTDLKGFNGTLVHGKEISTAALRHGDMIEVGQTRFRFCDEAMSLSPTVGVLLLVETTSA